jgi:MFS family permease
VNRLGSIRPLLRNGPFTRYIAGEAVSMTGTWMQMMAQGWVMTTLTDKAMLLGAVNFAMGIPMILFSMYGGVIADRHSKRNILILTQVVQIACAVTLGRLVATGQIQVWHLIAVALVLGTSAAFEMPAASAMIPELAGKEHIATAIAIDRSIFHGTRLVGPAAAGLLVAYTGPAVAFYANAVSFLALIAALWTIPRTVAVTDGDGSKRGGIKEGLRYVLSDKPTLAMIGLMVACVICLFPVMAVMMPLYATKVLGLGADRMGMLMGVGAIGSLTGSMSLLGVPKHHRRSVLFGAVVAVAAALVCLGKAQGFWAAAAALVLLTLGFSTLAGVTATVVQERAPGPMRGRVSAIVGLSFFGLMPFAGLGLTAIADWIGIRDALFVAAGCYLCVAIPVLIGPGRHITESMEQATAASR